MRTTIDRASDNNNTIAYTVSRPKIVWLLIGLQIVLAIGALFGGVAFILAPDGSLLQMPFSHLKNSPFSSFFIPGLLLFIFLGIYPFLVAYSLWKQPAWRWPEVLNPFKHMQWSWTGSLAAGIITIVWISVQVVWVPFGLVHIFYLAFGSILIGVTLLPQIQKYYRYGSIEQV